MEPYHSNPRAEALRWLGIAEKLLNTGDLVGSKTFAIRARDSDPSFEPADQILAVVDTLIAGGKRINNQQDWYAILQLFPLTHDSELIATQYRRLALLLNPQKNGAPFADHAFRLVVDAWSVLSNPIRKSIYDNELNLFSGLNSNRREQQYREPVQPQQQYREPEPPQQQYRQPEQPQQQYKEPEPVQQQHKEPEQPHQQQQQQQRKNNNLSSNNDKSIREERPIRSTDDKSSSFWTACPYCYYMYEYPRVYVECSLRCQNCRRAFHAVVIPSPPPIVDGKEGYFSCWGFFPIGFSMSDLEKNKGGAAKWAPFSQIFTCPQVMGKNGGKRKVGRPKNVNARKSSGPQIYIDDDDIFVEVSDSSEDSDYEWGSTRKKKKKKAKNAKGKGSAGKNVKTPEKAKNVKVSGGENLQGGFVMQEGVGATPNVSIAESSKKAAANSAKKQPGRVVRELGKLDLNVEFSNEVEEPAPGMSGRNAAGNGEEDNIEGIGFFEGLDEFLSSLPILNAVGDDKVKAA